MNPLSRGVHSSSKNSKAYKRMQNDFVDTDESPQPGRLRLVSTRRKKQPSTSTDGRGINKSEPSATSVKIEMNDNSHDSWTGEFPSEFSGGGRPSRNHRSAGAEMEGSVVTSGNSVYSSEAAVAPTISRPFADTHRSRDFTHASAPASSAQKSVVSQHTFDSHEQVEKPSITSPSLHAWSRHNRMGGARKMLSEKTINTIQSTATTGTKDTTGTLNTSGGHTAHTATTADSTLRGSIASIAGASLQDFHEMMNTSPGNDSSFSNLLEEEEEERAAATARNSPPHSRRQDMNTPPETEEDRMMRLAMEMSLREFEEQQATFSTNTRSKAAFREAHDQVQIRNQLNTFYRQNSCHSLLTTATEEVTEVLVENPHRIIQRSRQSSNGRLSSHLDCESRTPPTNRESESNPTVLRQLEAARANLPREEAEAIERALREAGEQLPSRPSEVPSPEQQSFAYAAAPAPAQHISLTEAEEIDRAIREADAMENQQSINVALQLQAEETGRFNNGMSSPQMEGMGQRIVLPETSPFHQMMHQDFDWDFSGSNPASYPIGEDLEANMEMMAFDFEADEDIAFLGNTAFNAFKRTLSRESAKSNKSATRAELDARVQVNIKKAVSNDLITKCNGVVKEGKEAAIYHADGGEDSNGHDVAIKVFRRLRSFRALSERFRDASPQEQLEIWAEKEYRNLIRASRARVPVASPLLQKENLVFMRFMGDDGWPSPQLKEMELKKGSAEWTLLYSQTMVAVRRLYVTARLVHGDLSAENILVCPAQMVENKDDGGVSQTGEEIQAVLIDLAQAVDVAHPLSGELLSKDVDMIRKFFNKKGIKTLSQKMAIEFVTAPDPEAEKEQLQSDHNEQAVAHGAALAVAAVLQPDRAVSIGSLISKSSQSSHSRVPDRAMSQASSSTKSSGVSNSLPDRAFSMASTSTGTSSHSTGSSHNKEKEKKVKKEKKAKKEKKKKKDKSEKSSSRKSSKEQPATIDRDLFPIRAESSTNELFLEGNEELREESDWDSEWNEEVACTTTSPASP